MTTPIARTMWALFEPLHAVTYFAPQARKAADDAGYRGFWMSYYAMRIAPLGAVGAEVATSAFYGFSPTRGQQALPDAWRHASPEQALEARLRGAEAALRTAWAAGHVHDGHLEEVAHLLEDAAGAVDTSGRVLTAANTALPQPVGPHRRLWQAATVLREHRGDGHNAALVAAGIGPVHAHLLKEASGETEGDVLRTGRDWPQQTWKRAEADLVERTWLTEAGQLTALGKQVRGDVEERTDAAAAAPWQAWGSERTQRLAELLLPLAQAVLQAGFYRVPSPIGAPMPGWQG